MGVGLRAAAGSAQAVRDRGRKRAHQGYALPENGSCSPEAAAYNASILRGEAERVGVGLRAAAGSAQLQPCSSCI